MRGQARSKSLELVLPVVTTETGSRARLGHDGEGRAQSALSRLVSVLQHNGVGELGAALLNGSGGAGFLLPTWWRCAGRRWRRTAARLGVVVLLCWRPGVVRRAAARPGGGGNALPSACCAAARCRDGVGGGALAAACRAAARRCDDGVERWRPGVVQLHDVGVLVMHWRARVVRLQNAVMMVVVKRWRPGAVQPFIAGVVLECGVGGGSGVA
ncbi:hypothetical protein PLICRDRAFT_698512 [Plicaturopsis crispa FD-325 SS-3]|nr:hypothetical protein PLICRDRAFT_698512 [Plicaturopsis crispa FD-325 SS-3]